MRPPNPPTPADEVAAVIESLTAGIPAQELNFYGISNDHHSLSLRNYLLHTSALIARAPTLEQLQPAATAAIAAMKKARVRARKEQREKTAKPPRRSTQMAGTRYRQAHATISA